MPADPASDPSPVPVRVTSRRSLYAGLGALSILLGAWTIFATPPMEWRYEVPTVISAGTVPFFTTVLDYSYAEGTAHAPAIRVLPEGFSLLWFEGRREGSADIAIMEQKFVGKGQTWSSSPPRVLLTAPMVQAVMRPPQAVRTLGNTVQLGASPDQLLVTVVSIGGWAAASIAMVTLKDDAPVQAEKLNLSPFINRSYLVRAPTLGFSDGDVALPAYFEMKNGFGEQVRIGADGRVRDKNRITQQSVGIQPSIVPLDRERAVAFSRDFDGSRRLVASWTQNGGRNWERTELLEIPNPGAPVAALGLENGDILMAFNDAERRSDILRLAISSDGGRSWRRIATLEESAAARGNSARYVFMRRLASGEIVLAYSVGSKRGIRAHVFNDAWAQSR
jgi:BNR repeat protein